MESEGTFELLPKKEVIGIKKEYEKLNKVLSGIRKMEKLPDAMIIVDPKKEANAIHEARKLGIPVFGLVDTNCDPDDVDYVVPGNDDAVRSVKVVLGVLNNAICEGKNLPLVDYITEEEKKPNAKKESAKEEEAKAVETVTEEAAKEIIEEKESAELSSMTLTELKALAKDKKIKNYSSMKKDELI